jgi:hypothetical protein
MTQFLIETCAVILSIKHCVGNVAFTSKGMLMLKKTLTLKSTSRITKPAITAPHSASIRVAAGRQSKLTRQQSCTAVIDWLRGLIENRCKVFIEMRHGTGYCGVPALFEDGWLTMINVSIHGTKQTAEAPSILIQIHDGSFIAHLHPVSAQQKIGGAK